MNTMTVEDYIAQANALYEKARGILTNPGAPAEEKQHVPKMIEDANVLKTQAAQLKDLEAQINAGASVARQATSQAQPGPQGFKSAGEFLTKVFQAGDTRYRGPLDPRLKAFDGKGEAEVGPMPSGQSGVVSAGWSEQKATMVENVGARGGFLVPIEQRSDLLGIEAMTDPFASRATHIPMRRRQVFVPVVNQAGTTAGQPHWFGGMLAYWTEEGAEKTQSDPTFKQIALTAHKLVCYTRASEELLDDEGVGLAAFLSGALGFAGAINWYSSYAYLRGTGLGQPLGVINAAATISIAAQANPPAPGSIYTDLVNMMEAFLPSANGIWFINQRHMSDLMLANGPAANPIYLWGSMTNGAPGTLLGYPVVFTEKLPAPGSAGSILLADPRYYLIGDRQATTIESSGQERFKYDEISWRAVHRTDGQPWLSAPLTLADGTAQVSPFVILGAKST